MIALLLLFIVSVGAVGDELKFFDDRLLYSISYLSHDQLAAVPPEAEFVPLKSADEENYQCLLPEIILSVSPSLLFYASICLERHSHSIVLGPLASKDHRIGAQNERLRPSDRTVLGKLSAVVLFMLASDLRVVCGQIDQVFLPAIDDILPSRSLGNSMRRRPRRRSSSTIWAPTTPLRGKWVLFVQRTINPLVVQQTIEKFDPLDVPKVEVGGVKLAYYPVVYKNGGCSLSRLNSFGSL